MVDLQRVNTIKTIRDETVLEINLKKTNWFSFVVGEW